MLEVGQAKAWCCLCFESVEQLPRVVIEPSMSFSSAFPSATVMLMYCPFQLAGILGHTKSIGRT